MRGTNLETFACPVFVNLNSARICWYCWKRSVVLFCGIPQSVRIHPPAVQILKIWYWVFGSHRCSREVNNTEVHAVGVRQPTSLPRTLNHLTTFTITEHHNANSSCSKSFLSFLWGRYFPSREYRQEQEPKRLSTTFHLILSPHPSHSRPFHD